MGFVLRKNKPNDATTTQTTKKKCQRCFSLEHWTFECVLKPGDQGTYVKRQSKTEMLKKRRTKRAGVEEESGRAERDEEEKEEEERTREFEQKQQQQLERK